MRIERVIITCDQDGCDKFFASSSGDSHNAILASGEIGWGYDLPTDKNFCPDHKISGSQEALRAACEQVSA